MVVWLKFLPASPPRVPHWTVQVCYSYPEEPAGLSVFRWLSSRLRKLSSKGPFGAGVHDENNDLRWIMLQLYKEYERIKLAIIQGALDLAPSTSNLVCRAYMPRPKQMSKQVHRFGRWSLFLVQGLGTSTAEVL